MKQIELLDKNIYSKVENYFKELNIEIDKRTLTAYSNLCYIILQYCENKISVEELLTIYDIVTDILEGKHPEIIIQLQQEDRIIWTKKILEGINEYGFNKKEIEFIAFCIVYSYFMIVINKETNEPEQAIYLFYSKEEILNYYEQAKEEKIWKFDIKRYSNPDKEDYGYSLDNPIEVMSIGSEYAYLNNLVTDKGDNITYNRIGSYIGIDDIIIDGYDIFVKKSFKTKNIAVLYIYGNAERNSDKAPKGFKFK